MNYRLYLKRNESDKIYLYDQCDENIEDSELGLNLFEFNNISKINIFVGPNNSGKSRVLRKICCDHFTFDDQEFRDFVNKKIHILEQNPNIFKLHISDSILNYLNDINKKLIEILNRDTFNKEIYIKLLSIKNEISNIDINQIHIKIEVKNYE